jgi:probable HAF family extracellular repeat protein
VKIVFDQYLNSFAKGVAVMFRRNVMVLSVLLLLLSAMVENVWGNVPYTLTDLGIAWNVTGINNSGHIIGADLDMNNAIYIQAFLCQGSGGKQYLGALGGKRSLAYAINNDGTVVGVADYNSGGNGYAYIWKASSGMEALGTLGGPNSRAFAINSLGQVVGDAQNSSNYWHAFLYNGSGSLIDLIPNCNLSRATGINDSGHVVGYASFGLIKSFIYADNNLTYFGDQMWPNAINNDDIVVGSYQSNASAGHAFLYHYDSGNSGVVTDLGTLGGTSSEACAINNRGLVVGNAATSSGETHAFLYDGSGPMQDLNNLIDPSSGWQLNWADGINDSGQIVGIGQIGGQYRAFLLTSVPEPSTIALLLTATLGGLLWWRRRA